MAHSGLEAARDTHANSGADEIVAPLLLSTEGDVEHLAHRATELKVRGMRREPTRKPLRSVESITSPRPDGSDLERQAG